MTAKITDISDPAGMTNGPGAAALLAAGFGSFALALLAMIADKAPSVKAALIFWKPTGPLSGVTIRAVVGWLVVWLLLHKLWRKSSVNLGLVSKLSLALLALSLLLTFPPIADLL
jgi:hypothetical protein